MIDLRGERSGEQVLRRLRIGNLFFMGSLCVMMSASAFAETPPELNFDPFRAREKVADDVPEATRRSPVRAFRPVLQSTIVGTRGVLAVLGGVMLGIGEETEGYRLIEVRPFDATFEKNGETLRLEVVRKEGATP